MLDYYKETMKQYYQKFNLPKPKIEIVIDTNYDFGTRCQFENYKFSSAEKKFVRRTEKLFTNQFDGIRLDSGPHADEIIPIIEPYVGKEIAENYVKLIKEWNKEE